MELLPKTTWKDHLHYAVAFLGVCLSGALGMLAFHQTRMAIRAWGVLALWRGAGARIAEYVGWFVPGVALAVYILTVQPLYTSGVTEGRLWHAQGRPVPDQIAQHRLKRALWEHDLYLTAVRFAKTVWIPAAVYAIAYGVTELATYWVFH